MKITFVKDCPPIVASGNETYKAGTKADLRRGQELIDAGYAREGWEALKAEIGEVAYPREAMSDDELKTLAKEKDIKNYWSMNRDTLLERLADGDN